MNPQNLQIGQYYIVEWDEIPYMTVFEQKIHDPFTKQARYHFTCPSRFFYLSPDEVEEVVDYLPGQAARSYEESLPGYHECQYVNVSFFEMGPNVKMACRSCGRDQPRPPSQISDIEFTVSVLPNGVWSFMPTQPTLPSPPNLNPVGVKP